MKSRMPASTRVVRVRLPLALQRKLLVMARRRRTGIGRLIVQAVRAELHTAPVRGRKKK
jgi:hypothetical protein